jgi:hypothetical protein
MDGEIIVPESKSHPGQKKSTPPAKRTEKKETVRKSPSWYAPTMITLMVLGLVWVVITYITQSSWPIPKLGEWNLAVGFGFIIVGFGMTAGWK